MTMRFKVCCIQSTDEAQIAIRAGAYAVGLVAEMPNGPGPIGDELILEITDFIRRNHNGRAHSVLLTSRTDGAAIVDHVSATKPDMVQIVDTPQTGAYEFIRRAHPSLKIIQVIHVEDEGAIDEARAVEKDVDFVLLDSGKPSSPERTLGGTGDVHDWSVSKRIVDALVRPVFLAGGLSPENVKDAIGLVAPFGVDLCSGLRDRDNGYALIPERAEAFADALKAM